MLRASAARTDYRHFARRVAIRCSARALGPDHPLAAYAENILGGILLDVNQPREAEAVIRSSLAKRRRMLPPGHWLIASSQSNLGAAPLALGRLDEAGRELREAYATLLADRGPEHEKTKLTAARLEELASLSLPSPCGRGPLSRCPGAERRARSQLDPGEDARKRYAVPSARS